MAERLPGGLAFATAPTATVGIPGPTSGPLVTRAAAEIGDAPVTMVRITALMPADSPRLGGPDAAHVRLLAELDDVPPIIVHRSSMRVIDGVHRLRAAALRGQDVIAARLVDVAEPDLFVLAVQLNTSHGLPLSTPDRFAAAARVIAIHPEWSDRWIASVSGLSPRSVAGLRRRTSDDAAQSNGRIGRDGRVRPIDASGARMRAHRLMLERPEAGLREIARVAGVSLGTAQDVRKRMREPASVLPAPARTEPLAVERGPTASRTIVREAGGATVSLELLRSFELLKKDPSLRFSEAGRTVLRLLDANSRSAEAWVRLAGGVPPHCRAIVSELARRCARSWMQFADEIERGGPDE